MEPDAVDDVVADTFAVAWRRLPREGDPLPWLYGVARRVVHGHRRSHARRGALLRKLGGRARAVPARPGRARRRRPRAGPCVRDALGARPRGDPPRRLGAARQRGRRPRGRLLAGTFAVRLSRARARLRAALADAPRRAAPRSGAADDAPRRAAPRPGAADDRDASAAPRPRDRCPPSMRRSTRPRRRAAAHAARALARPHLARARRPPDPGAPMTDDLMTRLRAADPAAGPPAAPPPPRRAVAAARRQRAGRRATAGGAAVVAAALALALAPFGGGGGPSPVLASAAEAAQLPPGSIVVTTSAVTFRSSEGAGEQRRTTWVRVGGRGQVLAVRTRNLRDGKLMSDEVSRGSGADAVQESRDPRTGAVTVERGTWTVPSALLLDAKAVLDAARPDDVEDATFDGRAAHRIVVTGAEEPALAGDRDELIVDAETFAPLLLRKHSEGTAVDGKPFTYDYSERVLEQRTLDDTPANRAAAFTLR